MLSGWRPRAEDRRVLAGAGVAAVAALVSMAVIAPSANWLGGTVFATGLTIAAAVDARRQIVPDGVNALLVATGLATAALIGAEEALNRSLGAAIGYLILAGLAAAYRRLRGRDGLGLGDAKLLAGCGAWLGWAALPPVMLVASLSGLAYAALMMMRGSAMTGATRLAFAPHIAFGAWIVWLARGNNVIP